MRIEQFSFQNRHNLKIVGEVWHPENSKGLAFIHHGLSGERTQPHIRVMTETFYKNGYTTVVFDSTHSWGESDGDLEQSTLTTHWQDFEDVILWSQSKDFYQEPFILAGHSMGGFTTLYLGIKYKNEVKALFPASTMISGKLSYEQKVKTDPTGLQEWKHRGYYIKQHRDKPDVKGKVSWNWLEDAMKYDLLEPAASITCPVLLVVGDKDPSTTPEQHKLLFDKLGGPKELVIIPDCEHTFRSPQKLKILEESLNRWLRTL